MALQLTQSRLCNVAWCTTQSRYMPHQGGTLATRHTCTTELDSTHLMGKFQSSSTLCGLYVEKEKRIPGFVHSLCSHCGGALVHPTTPLLTVDSTPHWHGPPSSTSATRPPKSSTT